MGLQLPRDGSQVAKLVSFYSLACRQVSLTPGITVDIFQHMFRVVKRFNFVKPVIDVTVLMLQSCHPSRPTNGLLRFASRWFMVVPAASAPGGVSCVSVEPPNPSSSDSRIADMSCVLVRLVRVGECVGEHRFERRMKFRKATLTAFLTRESSSVFSRFRNTLMIFSSK